jgi:hypothetical protein
MLALFALLWGMASVGLFLALWQAARTPQGAGPAAGQRPAPPHPLSDALNGTSPHGQPQAGMPPRKD